MATLEGADKAYTTLLSEIETGQIKIPQFQRQFVWDLSSSAKLLDSILKGYPIGTFIYWRTNERLRAVRNIGNIDLPEPRDGEFVNYVLDGQQRITSLFAALKGETITREDGHQEDFSAIYVDLEAGTEDPLVIVDPANRAPNTFVKLTDLMNQGRRFFQDFPEKYDEKLDRYKAILQAYQFKGINLKDAEIDVATEVFTRLNVGGKSLSLFEIMVAKTYDPVRSFDLYEKFEELKQELLPSKYDTISAANVLQLISLLLKRDCKSKTILKLERAAFIDQWEPAMDSIKRAIDFFRAYGIPVSRLLPYNALIVPFGYFFHKHPSNPTGQTKRLLEDFFWRVSMGFRYSSAVESKLVQDIEKIDEILAGRQPKYEWGVDVSENALRLNGYFGTGRSLIKAILCLYAMHKPKSFDSGLDVNIDNSWLKIATSKNYHHFFPKAYMRKDHPATEAWLVNHIVNITIVDDRLNKNRIKAKPPATYMKTFAEENEDLATTMATHLIDNVEEFGVWENDYGTFFNKRLKRICAELNRRIIPQQAEQALEVYQDVEEPETADE